MINRILPYIFIIGVVLFAGCKEANKDAEQMKDAEFDTETDITNNVSAEDCESTEESLMAYTPKPQMQEVVEYFYKTYVFGKKDFDMIASEKFCIHHLRKQLRAEDGGDGYAIGRFRTSNQKDSSKKSKITEFKRIDESNHTVVFDILDKGTSATVTIKFEYENGSWKFADVSVKEK